MKRCFKKTSEKTCLNVTELNMILTEIGRALNSRHLRYPHVDLNKATSRKHCRKWNRSGLCPVSNFSQRTNEKGKVLQESNPSHRNTIATGISNESVRTSLLTRENIKQRKEIRHVSVKSASAWCWGDKEAWARFYCLHFFHYSTMLAGGSARSAVESYAFRWRWFAFVPANNLSIPARVFKSAGEI